MKRVLLMVSALWWAAIGWAQPGRVIVEVDAMHRSDVLPNGFLRTLLVGGTLEREALEGIHAAMGRADMGYLGLQGGGAVAWEGLPGAGGLRPRVQVETRGVMAAAARRELFGLAFLGNAHALGTAQMLSGSAVRYLQWNRLAFGLSDADGRRWVEVGAYLAGWGGAAELTEGKVEVAPGVDALEVRAVGRFDAWEHRGWGVGLATRQVWGDARWWAVEVRDLGVVRYGRGERFSVDTALVTSGLPWAGPGWTVEGVQAEGFGEELTARRETGEGWQVLPARLLVEGGWRWSAGWSARGSVEVGGWMPRPQVEGRLRWHVDSDWALEAAVRAGGWGQVRPVFRAEWRRATGHLALCWEDPVGGFSATGYGRGLQVIWSKNLSDSR